MESSRVALLKTIYLIENKGQKKSKIISREEIAKKIGISIGELNDYLTGQMYVPQFLPGMLWDAYEDLISDSNEESSSHL